MITPVIQYPCGSSWRFPVVLRSFINLWMMPCIVTGGTVGVPRGPVLAGGREPGSGKRGGGSTSHGLVQLWAAHPPVLAQWHLHRGWRLRAARQDGLHAVRARRMAASNSQPPSVQGGIWLRTIAPHTGLPGGNGTQAFLLERWQSRRFFIKFLSCV